MEPGGIQINHFLRQEVVGPAPAEPPLPFDFLVLKEFGQAEGSEALLLQR